MCINVPLPLQIATVSTRVSTEKTRRIVSVGFLQQEKQDFTSVGANLELFYQFFSMQTSKGDSLIFPRCWLFNDAVTSCEFRHALSRCVESVVGFHGFPSLFSRCSSCWQDALAKLFTLVLSWGTVPSLWKHSVVVSIFEQGDAIDSGSATLDPQSHQTAAPSVWGADVSVDSFSNVLSMRDINTIEKAFYTSWIEATLVRLHDTLGV